MYIVKNYDYCSTSSAVLVSVTPVYSLTFLAAYSSNYIDCPRHRGGPAAIVVSRNRRIDSLNLITLGIAGLQIHFLKVGLLECFHRILP